MKACNEGKTQVKKVNNNNETKLFLTSHTITISSCPFAENKELWETNPNIGWIARYSIICSFFMRFISSGYACLHIVEYAMLTCFL